MFKTIKRIIDWCGEYGLNMVLDLHKTYGFSFDDGEEECVDVFALTLRGDILEYAVELAVAVVIGIEEATEVIDIFLHHGVAVALRHIGVGIAEEHIGCETH